MATSLTPVCQVKSQGLTQSLMLIRVDQLFIMPYELKQRAHD